VRNSRPAVVGYPPGQAEERWQEGCHCRWKSRQLEEAEGWAVLRGFLKQKYFYLSLSI
jgi:hypothetical protein